MIRNLMLAVGLFTLTGASAMAAPVRHTAAPKVAKADEAAPAADAKEPKKATKKPVHKKDKKEAAPAAEPAPAPAK
jgi:hypothetical protein